MSLSGGGRGLAATVRSMKAEHVQQKRYSPLYQQQDFFFLSSLKLLSCSDHLFLQFSLPRLSHKAAGSSFIRYCCVVLKVMIHWRNKARLKCMQYINAHSCSVSPALLSALFSCAVGNTTCIRALYHALENWCW